jgi:hypothetical protein
MNFLLVEFDPFRSSSETASGRRANKVVEFGNARPMMLDMFDFQLRLALRALFGDWSLRKLCLQSSHTLFQGIKSPLEHILTFPPDGNFPQPSSHVIKDAHDGGLLLGGKSANSSIAAVLAES